MKSRELDSKAETESTLSRQPTSEHQQIAEQPLLRLQRKHGNRYVQRVLAQAKKSQGEGEVAPDVEQAIQRARGGGQSLDSGVRAQMEPALGADFSDVQVHADAQADRLSRALNARAFTTGQDIFFQQGAYNPGSSSGRELLAHELTHVVQQNGDEVQRKLTVGQPDDHYEQEADRVARVIVQQEGQPIRKDTDEGLVQRQTEEEEGEGSQPSPTLTVARQGGQGNTFVSTDTITLTAQTTGVSSDQVSWTVHGISANSGDGNPHTATNKNQFTFTPNPTKRPTTGSRTANDPIVYRVQAQVQNLTADLNLRQDETDIIRQEYIDFGATPPGRGRIFTPTKPAYNVGNYTLIVDNGLDGAFNATETEFGLLTQQAAAQTPVPSSATQQAAVTIPAINVTSGYRNPRRNVAAGSKYPVTSRHVWGKALDLVVAGANATLWTRLRQAGANAGYTSICEDGPNQKPCNDSSVDHVHIQW